MTSESTSFSVIIPTYDRQDDLYRCVESVAAQTRPPEEVIIVNDGHLDQSTIDTLVDEFTSQTEIQFTKSQGTPSSSTARNTGIRLATQQIVVLLDDDVELGTQYLDRLAQLYDAHDSPQLAGIGGVDPNDLSTPSQEWWYDLFYKGDPWQINRAGMSTLRADDNLANGEPTRADWLIGNNMSFKREIIGNHLFPQWDKGREPHEDLAVGWDLKNHGYHCLIDPTLPFEHHRTPSDSVDPELWIAVGANRVHNFRQYGNPLDTPLFAWAMLGEILQQFIVTTASYRERLTRAASLFYGALTASTTTRTAPKY